MEFVATFVVLASTYALLAAGIVILYRASRVLNFAHGELAIIGGYVFLSMTGFAGGSLPLAFAGALAVSLVTGIAIYVVVMKRLTGQPFYVAILVTIGIGILLKSLIIIVWRARATSIPIGSGTVLTFASGARMSQLDLATVLVAIAFYLGLYLFYRFSRLGIQARGTAENPLLASQRGVNVHFVLALSWAIAVLGASVAGILYGGRALLSPQGVVVGFSGLTAALVGGLDSLLGALLGSLIVALAEYLTIQYLDPILGEAVPFIILLLAMLLRPWGLFGTREEIERV